MVMSLIGRTGTRFNCRLEFVAPTLSATTTVSDRSREALSGSADNKTLTFAALDILEF